MNEIHCGADLLRECDRAAERELLRELGVDVGEVRALHPLVLAKLLVVELDEVLVFGVHDHDAAVVAHDLHRVADATEVEAVGRPLRMLGGAR